MTVEGTPAPAPSEELLTASAAAHSHDSFARTLLSDALQSLAHSVGNDPLDGQSLDAKIFVRRSTPPTDELPFPHIELCVRIPEHGGHPEHLVCVFWPPIFGG